MRQSGLLRLSKETPEQDWVEERAAQMDYNMHPPKNRGHPQK